MIPVAVAGAATAVAGLTAEEIAKIAAMQAAKVLAREALKKLGIGAAAATFPPLAPAVALAGAGLAVWQIGKFIFDDDEKK